MLTRIQQLKLMRIRIHNPDSNSACLQVSDLITRLKRAGSGLGEIIIDKELGA
jgi:hypothetical protein